MEQGQTFARQQIAEKCRARHVPAGVVEASTKSVLNRIAAYGKNNGDCCRRFLRGKGCYGGVPVARTAVPTWQFVRYRG